MTTINRSGEFVNFENFRQALSSKLFHLLSKQAKWHWTNRKIETFKDIPAKADKKVYTLKTFFLLREAVVL